MEISYKEAGEKPSGVVEKFHIHTGVWLHRDVYVSKTIKLYI